MFSLVTSTVHPQQVADDTKLCGTVKMREGRDAIQRDPGRPDRETCANNGVQHDVKQDHVKDPKFVPGQFQEQIQAGQRMD